MAQGVKNLKSRKTFNASFKLQVVRIIKAQGLSIGQVCKDMNLGGSAVGRSLAKFEAEQAGQNGIVQHITAANQAAGV